MAKSKSFFGLRRGSTKSLTFQVLNGRQVTKDRVYDVKNPRTFSQMQQRMVMATAAAAYAGMREIVDHSFEGYTYGQPTMSEFIRLNAKMLRDKISSNNTFFNFYKERNVLPNEYLVSKGTISTVSYIDEIDIVNDSFISANWCFPVIQDNTTLNDLLKSVGISSNGYITFIVLAYSPERSISQFAWLRLTPKQSELNTEVVNTMLSDKFDTESNIPVDVSYDFNKTDAFVPVGFDFDEGGIQYCACGMILSDKKIKWLRSSTKLQTVNNLENDHTAATALATYPVGTDYILNGGTV